MPDEHALSHSGSVRLAIVHYSFPPVIGGVETIISEHAHLFAEAGHEVTVICRRGASADGRIAVERIEADGSAGMDQWLLSPPCLGRLRGLLRKQHLVLVHNLLTMPFGWDMLGALAAAAGELTAVRFIAWVHDLAAINASYSATLNVQQRKLLSRAHRGFEYVGVSKLRCQQFETLTGVACRLIPNGINLGRVLGLSRIVGEFENKYEILACDYVLFQPARLLQRKNVELTLRVLAALSAAGRKCAALITAAPDAHNPASQAYAAELAALRDRLGSGYAAFFLHEHFEVGAAELTMLYQLADVLFLPSREEGFALPLLEAAIHRIPAVCADIEPLRSFPGATVFGFENSPEKIAATLMQRVDADAEIQQRKQTLSTFSWNAIYRNYLEPLVAETEARPHS